MWTSVEQPAPSREASGTSGEKVPINGGINFSVLDGWWRESFNGKNGWSIGEEKEYDNLDIQDSEDANSMYLTLRTRSSRNITKSMTTVSPSLVKRMRDSIKSVVPTFSTARMVKDYVNNLYLPAHDYSKALNEDNEKGARACPNGKIRYRKPGAKYG